VGPAARSTLSNFCNAACHGVDEPCLPLLPG
jgi:hypothetical protein